MIIRVSYNDSGDRFEDVMNVESREEAIQQAEYNFNYNKSRSGRGYYKSIQLIECEGDKIEDSTRWKRSRVDIIRSGKSTLKKF